MEENVQTNLKITQENEQNIPKSSSNKKIIFFLITLVIILLISTFTAIYLYQNSSYSKKTTKQSQNLSPSPTTTNNSLKKESLAVYTRCFGGERQPSKCNIYTSSLTEPEEKLVYSFDFPKVKQSDYEPGFELSVKGNIGRNIVYQKNYWETTKSGFLRVFGIINIDSGKNIEIYKNNDKNNSGYLVGNYLDKQNQKIYYSTEDSPDKNSKIFQYDLVKMQSNEIINSKNLKNSYEVILTFNNKLFLSPIIRIGDHTSWENTYDLSSRSLTQEATPIANPVFNEQGDKYAYLKMEKLSDEVNYNLRLMLGNTKDKSEKEITSILSTRVIPGDGGCNPAFACTNIYSLGFNNSGTELSYSIMKHIIGSNNYEAQNYLYREIPDSFKNQLQTILKINPQNLQYTWVNFYQPSPAGPQLTDGLLYKNNNTWFIKPIYANNNSDIDLLSHNTTTDMISIVSNTNKVIIIP